MFRPPFAARVAAGIAVTLVEEVQKLPSTALTLPMTAVSQVLQTGMHVQQTVTALAIKGDEALAALFPPSDEQPSWATFDEDDSSPAVDARTVPAVVDDSAESEVDVPSAPSSENGRAVPDAPTSTPANNGHFELYTTAPAPEGKAAPAPAAATADRPEIADYLDYDNLTLAQLRARLRSLSVDELTALLDYENGTRTRAPFQTMLGNRITAATAK
ncbi:lipid droplet-associated protein [Rhodococcus triatomae]|nr:hypothetical protein G419_11002 [Rhodococcus triatomae BKS 15-14]